MDLITSTEQKIAKAGDDIKAFAIESGQTFANRLFHNAAIWLAFLLFIAAIAINLLAKGEAKQYLPIGLIVLAFLIFVLASVYLHGKYIKQFHVWLQSKNLGIS